MIAVHARRLLLQALLLGTAVPALAQAPAAQVPAAQAPAAQNPSARNRAPQAVDPSQPRPSSDPAEFLSTPPKPSTLKGQLSLVTLGDLLYSKPSANSPDPELQKVLQVVRKGDVVIANREGMFFDMKTFHGENSVGGLLGEPTLGPDMKAMGVSMVSMANNHTSDWGWEGMVAAQKLLDDSGIVHAGGGMTLQEARAPGVLTTPKGRVALVSTASTFKVLANAADPGRGMPGRPGLSPLRLRTIHLVTPEQWALLRKFATETASPLSPAPKPDAREIDLGGQIYQLSDHTGLTYEMELYDHAGLLKAVREAKDKADLVVFTIHAHESPTGMDDDNPIPPDFLIPLFHNAVDAGADLILGGGQHSLRGIEIYKGKPVLYGMGVFFINGDIRGIHDPHVFPDATGHAPPPRPPSISVREGGNPASWYDGIVAVTDFDKDKAKVLRLYPLDLGNTYDTKRRGIPHFADPEYARRILANLQQDSAQFGTKIAIEGTAQNPVGVIRIQ